MVHDRLFTGSWTILKQTEAVLAVKEFRKDLETDHRGIEEATVDEIEKEFRRLISAVEEDEKKTETEQENVTEAENYVKKLDGNKAQQFVCLKLAQWKLASTRDVSRILENPVDPKIKFYGDRMIQNLLHGFRTFGAVSRNAATSLGPRTALYTLRGDLQVNMSDDTQPPNLTGSCFTEDGFLLLTDQANNKLKRADLLKLSVDCCSVANHPTDVCCINKNEAVVAFNQSNTIQFVSLGNKMAVIRQLQMESNCFGIHGIGHINDMFYATTRSCYVNIHDMSGKLLKTVTRTTGSGKLAFSDIGDRVYVTDTQKGVISFDLRGEDVKTFRHNEAAYPTGICTDCRGNLFVSDCSSNNVVQIAQSDGRCIGRVLKREDGVASTQSVSFDPLRNILVVTQSSGNDALKVFNFL